MKKSKSKRAAAVPKLPARDMRAIIDSQFVRQDEKLARLIERYAKIVDFEADTALVEQNGDDDDVFLIIRGSVAIVIDGKVLDTRRGGQLVGEMEAIEPTKKRIATVVGSESGRTIKLSGRDFLAILDQHPRAWRNIVLDFSDRLQYRTKASRRLPNVSPRVFIGSSKETVQIAMAIQVNLQRQQPDLDVAVWNDEGGFTASQYPLDELHKHVERADFALFVLGPDDVAISRGKTSRAPRDNVVFETGLFMGALGRERTLVMSPSPKAGQQPLKIWSDLAGLTFLPYVAGRAGDAVTGISAASLNEISIKLIQLVKEFGVR